MSDYDFYAEAEGTLFYFDEVNGDYVIYSNAGDGWEIFATLDLPADMEPADVVANGPDWAMEEGADLTVTSYYYLDGEPEPTDEESSLGEGSEGEPSIDWSDSSAESPDEAGSSEGGTAANGDGTGDGAADGNAGGTGEGDGDGETEGDGEDEGVDTSEPEDATAGISDSMREALEDAIDAYESAYDDYLDALDEYESAVADAESAADEIESLADDAEDIGEDIEDLADDLEEDQEAYEESFDSIARVLGVSVDAQQYGESLQESPAADIGDPGDGVQVEDAPAFAETAAEPVALFSGAYWHEAVDVNIPALGLPLRVSRRYSNQIFREGLFGMKWDSWLDAHVRVMSSGAVYVWTGEARGVWYLPDDAGGFTTPASERARLEWTGSRHRLVDGFGLTRGFDGDGRLASINDRFGNTLRVTRDPAGLPTEIRDATGRTLTVTTASGHITAITDWTGRSWSYTYSGDELRSATRPATAAHPAGSRTSYGYESGDDPRTRHNLASIENALGDVLVENTYGQSGGRLNRVTHQSYTGQGYDFSYEIEDDLPATLEHVGALSRRTIVVDPGGVRAEYEFDPLGNLLTERVEGADGPWETEHGYDALGHHHELREPGGHTLRFTYDVDAAAALDRHRLLEVRSISAAGDSDLVTQLTYGPYQQVASLTDPSGETITYELDALGLATRVIPPEVTLADGATLSGSATLTYRADGQVASLDTQEGVHHEWTYYESGTRRGQLRWQEVDGTRVLTLGHDTLGRLATLTDAAGEIWTVEYDEQDHTVAERGPAATGAALEYDYDVAGRPVARRERIVGADGTPGDPEWSEVRYTLDARGRPTAVEQDLAAGAVATVTAAWRYDDQPTELTDATGMVTRLSYDERGLLVERRTGHGSARVAVETWTYAAHGLPERYTDPLGAAVACTYDGHLRLASATNALGERATYSWRAAGPIDGYEWYDATGILRAEERFTIDELGRIRQVRERVIDPDGTHVGWLRQRAIFDGHGRTVRVIGSAGATIETTYDAHDRPVRVEDPVGNAWVLTRDSAGRVTHLLEQAVDGASGETRNFEHAFRYDAMGRLASQTDGLGNVTGYERDARGLLTAVVDPTGLRTEYTYDLAGRLTAEVRPRIDWDGTAHDPAETGYEHDAQGRLTAITDPQSGQVRLVRDGRGDVASVLLQDGSLFAGFTYDAASNPLTQRDARGVVTTWEYDALSRPVERTITLAGGAVGATHETFAYDAVGYLATAANEDHAVAIRRDSIGRAWSESLDGREVTRDWRTDGLLQSETFAGLATARTGWDSAARLQEVRLSALGAGFPGGAASGVLATLTHQGGHPSTTTHRNGLTTTTTLDAAGRLTALHATDGTTTVEGLYALRDARGHVRARLREGVETLGIDPDAHGRIGRAAQGAAEAAPDLSAILPGTGTTHSPAGDQAEADAIAGALRAAAAEETRTYTYDAAGNRLELLRTDDDGSEATAATYDAAHRLRSIDGVTISSDAVGNVTADGTHHYAYDAANRLASVTRDADGVEILALSYDPLGRLAAVTTEHGRRELLYSGTERVAEFDPGGACERLWVPGPWLDRPLARFEDGGGHYPLFDHVGTLLAWTDDAGAITERHRRDEFGRWQGRLDEAFSPLADRERSGEAGFHGLPAWSDPGDLHHMRARVYRPDWGRFLEPDPLGPLAGYQPYALGHGNPQHWIDPTGEIPPLVIAIAAGALIGAGIAAWANWDKEGADFWVAVGAGALGGAIMGTGYGVASFVAGGAVSGAIIGGYEGHKASGMEGAVIGGTFGLVAGGVAGGVGGALGQRVGTGVTGMAVSRLSSHLGKGPAYTAGTWAGVGAGGTVGGAAAGGIGGFGMGTGLGIAHGYDIDQSLRLGASAVPPGVLYGGLYGAAGGVGTKALMQGGFYYNTRTKSGVYGAEGEWFVQNATGQRMNTTHRTGGGKIPDLWGNVKGDVKNTQKIPSLNAQNRQLRSFLNAIQALGETMVLYHRPGVTAGPRSQVGRQVAAGNIELRPIPQWAYFPLIWPDDGC